MSGRNHAFADFLERAMARVGVDRKMLAKSMGGNPAKFYRRFDAWMRPQPSRLLQVPDGQIAKRLAHVLSVDVAEIWAAARVELAAHDYTVTDDGKVVPNPASQRPHPNAITWFEDLYGQPLELGLRDHAGLAASTLLRIEKWKRSGNTFERLKQESTFDGDWMLCFGGLLQLDGPGIPETRFYAWLRPEAIRTPVVVERHGFGFEGFVARDIRTAADLWDLGPLEDYDLMEPADAALQDLNRAAWIVQQLWPGPSTLIACSDWPRPETDESLQSALQDPFLATDTPAALYWLCRLSLDGDVHGLSKMRQKVSGSPSRLTRDAASVVA